MKTPDPAAVRELKYRMSVRIVQHIADSEEMTTEEYGNVYDSEMHEQLLNDLVAIVLDSTVDEPKSSGI